IEVSLARGKCDGRRSRHVLMEIGVKAERPHRLAFSQQSLIDPLRQGRLARCRSACDAYNECTHARIMERRGAHGRLLSFMAMNPGSRIFVAGHRGLVGSAIL